jgi:rRNA maturation protein Nop10
MAHADGDHVYACPMHPEVTGKEGDDCPKCGMKLEHNDNAGAVSNVSMQFSTNPATVNPNQEVTLMMTPKNKDNAAEQVALDVEHTKKIHLIVVNEDLSWFDHIHPEYNADGSYTVKEKFPTAGKYTLFADYKPSGGNHVVDNLNVTVTGTAPAAKKYGADQLKGSAGDGFTVSLTPEGGKFLTNMAMHINGVVMLNGKEVDVTTLEDYLGAKAHMVVVSLADKKYLHVHPSVEGGKFDLHTTFEKPGVYRGWIQFQSKGKIYTSDFTMNVGEGKAADMKDMKH